MKYISNPLAFQKSGHNILLERGIEGKTAMLDNLIELIVFTPRGSFNADPDFGLEYWDFEYSNINDTQFNNNSIGFDEFYNESIKRKCEESIRKSLQAYSRDCWLLMIILSSSSSWFMKSSTIGLMEVLTSFNTIWALLSRILAIL